MWYKFVFQQVPWSASNVQGYCLEFVFCFFWLLFFCFVLFFCLFFVDTCKNGPPKLVPPGTSFSINKDPTELILLQNIDSLWKIWTTSHRWKNVDPQHISLAKLGPVAYLGRFRGFWKLLRPISSAAVVSFPAARNTQFPCTLCDEPTFRTLHGDAET